MADFETQVEALTSIIVGITPEDNEVAQFLRDGVLDVTNRCIAINPAEALDFSRKSSEQTSQGFDVGTNQILSVIREAGTNNDWRECRQISFGLQSRATDVNSFHYASKFNPAYYIDQDTEVNVLPAPGGSDNGFIVHYVNDVPTDETNSALLTQHHEDIKYFPKNKVHLVVIYASIQSLRNYISNKVLDSDTINTDLIAPVLSSYSQSLPTFVTPNSFVLPVSPAGVNVDFSSVGTITDFVTPVFSLDSKPTITDLSISVTIPVPPVLDSSSINTSGLTNPAFTPPVMTTPNWSDVDNWINTEEDSEMSAARVQAIQMKVSEYSAKLQEAQAQFSKDNAILAKDLQIASQNASTYEQGKISKYSTELQSYQAEVGKQTQEWQANYQKDLSLFTENASLGLQQYQADLQKETSRVQASTQEFQAELSKALQEYQAETGYDMSKYQAEIQANAQKYQADLSKNQTDFETSLSKYSSDVQKV